MVEVMDIINYFDLIPRYEMILNQGDVIFPPWIWHETYINHNDGFVVALNYSVNQIC